MYALILAYIYILGLISYVVFKREVWILIIFYILFELSIMTSYRYMTIKWHAPRRISFILVYFLGYFSLYILYGDRMMNDDFVPDNFIEG